MRLPNRRDTGALSLSYAIIFPVVLFAILVIVQAGLYYMAHNLALAAANQGANAAREFNSNDSAGHAAAQALISQGSGMLQTHGVAVTRTATTVTVTVTGTAWSIVPGLPVSVTETVQKPIERFVP